MNFLVQFFKDWIQSSLLKSDTQEFKNTHWQKIIHVQSSWLISLLRYIIRHNGHRLFRVVSVHVPSHESVLVRMEGGRPDHRHCLGWVARPPDGSGLLTRLFHRLGVFITRESGLGVVESCFRNMTEWWWCSVGQRAHSDCRRRWRWRNTIVFDGRSYSNWRGNWRSGELLWNFSVRVWGLYRYWFSCFFFKTLNVEVTLDGIRG